MDTICKVKRFNIQHLKYIFGQLDRLRELGWMAELLKRTQSDGESIMMEDKVKNGDMRRYPNQLVGLFEPHTDRHCIINQQYCNQLFSALLCNQKKKKNNSLLQSQLIVLFF